MTRATYITISEIMCRKKKTSKFSIFWNSGRKFKKNNSDKLKNCEIKTCCINENQASGFIQRHSLDSFYVMWALASRAWLEFVTTTERLRHRQNKLLCSVESIFLKIKIFLSYWSDIWRLENDRGNLRCFRFFVS